MSCPASRMRATKAGCRSATQPTTKQVARTPHRSSRSRVRCVSSTTRDSRASQADGSARAGTPQTWNHSSTSMVNALITRPSGSGCRGRALRRDELGDGVDRAQHLTARLLVADDDAERPLELEDQLEGVDGIEAEAGAEERRGAVDLVGVDRQLEAADDRLLDLALQLVGHRSLLTVAYGNPPSTPITWPVM